MVLSLINRQDVLLAIIAAAEGQDFRRIHLQKAAFLVAEEIQRQFARLL